MAAVVLEQLCAPDQRVILASGLHVLQAAAVLKQFLSDALEVEPGFALRQSPQNGLEVLMYHRGALLLSAYIEPLEAPHA